ncbi:MAG: ABC transporter permease subunit [Nitriliruptorales bacterium]|nr:ABC transporter permease subunit [Nitriliruptorales bacterium]
MAADTLPVLSGVLRDQRRSLAMWGLALAAVSAMYIGFYPAMGETSDIDAFVRNMPEGLVEAMGYDEMATPAGYLRSTVYGLLAPALLLVFAIGAGARLIAGQEEDGTLELELTSPVARTRLVFGRILALWVDVVILVAVVALATLALVTALDMELGADKILAAATGLLLLVLGFGTIALAVGAATGRRAYGLAVAAGLAVVAFMFDAIGPAIGVDWMTTVSPFSWYIEPNPLAEGVDPGGFALLAAVPVVAAVLGLLTFDRRDLMV